MVAPTNDLCGAHSGSPQLSTIVLNDMTYIINTKHNIHITRHNYAKACWGEPEQALAIIVKVL